MRRFLAIVALGLATVAGRASTPAERLVHMQALVHDGKFSAALGVLQRLREGDRETVPVQMTAAEACLGLADPMCAEKFVARVGEHAPSTPGYQLLLGRTRFQRAAIANEVGDVGLRASLASEAADALAKALVEAPGERKTLEMHARALRWARRVGEARDAYKAWIAADPRNAGAYGAAAGFMAENGIWDETIALIAGAPRDDPSLWRDLRLSILRNGISVVPWETLRFSFEAFEREDNDESTKRTLLGFRAIAAKEGRESYLAVLDYLDADPQDRFGVSRLLERSGLIPGLNHAPVSGLVEPRIVEKREPDYPERARQAHMEGRVILIARVRVDGTVGSIHVMSSTDPVFEAAPIHAVSQWRYTPATLHEETIEVPWAVRVDFRLR